MNRIRARLKLARHPFLENQELQPLAMLGQELYRIEKIPIAGREHQRIVLFSVRQSERGEADIHSLLLLIGDVVPTSIQTGELYLGCALIAVRPIRRDALQGIEASTLARS